MEKVNSEFKDNGWRNSAIYTIAESANLAHVSSMTIRRWLYGYEVNNHEVKPILGDKEKKPQVSFLEFIEILVASGFRKNHVPLERIRMAHSFAQQEWGIEYPFASMDLEPLGGHILHRFDQEKPGVSLATLDTKLQQWTLPGFVIDTLHNFDYESKLVSRWYPIGKNIHIIVDPRVNAGLPTIEKSRITVQAVYRRWKAEYPMSFIASDLGLTKGEVEEALRHADEVIV